MEGERKKPFFEKHVKPLFMVLLFLLLLLFVFNLFSMLSITNEMEQQAAKAREEARPAVLQTVLIRAPDSCEKCSHEELLSLVQSFNVTEGRMVEAADAGEFITKYKLTQLPVLLIFGELEKTKLNLEQREDALLAARARPPYFDLQERRVRGLVEATLIQAASCPKCFDLGKVVDALGMELVLSKVTTLRQEEAEGLIQKYGLVKLPTLVLSSEAKVYKDFAEAWKSFGVIADDGSFVLTEPNPPYREVLTGKTRGLVGITYITDGGCGECYNVTLHKEVLEGRFGIVLVAERVLDLKEADALILTYNITSVPTIILSPEIKDYNLDSVLAQVGTFEKDGSYVFRLVEVFGAYRDMMSGKVVAPEKDA